MNIFTRIAAIASSVILLSVTASFAATYDSANGKISSTYADKCGVDANSSMYTVLVLNADNVNSLDSLTDDQILYVDQGTTLETFTNMGVKGSALSEGTYAMYVGSESMEEPTVEYFYVKENTTENKTDDPSIGIAVKGSVINGEKNDYYYIADITNYSKEHLYGMKFSYVKDNMLYEMYTKLPDDISESLDELSKEITGEAAVAFGIMMSGVPTTYNDTFTAIPYIMDRAVVQVSDEGGASIE